MINHNNDKIREWYQEGEVIHKVMGGGYLIYQRLTNSNIDPSTSYRWITLSGANDYICDGTTKYTKQQKQVSHDYQATWENVVPAVYRKGTLLEYNSTDCGYVPVVTQYRWVNLDPSTDYYCSGTTKMYKQQMQESTDSGQTWSNVVPAEFRMGGSAQTQCEECGYIPPIEPQYRTTSGTPYCDNLDKYVEVYSQVSYDGGISWTTTATTNTLVESGSSYCTCFEPSVWQGNKKAYFEYSWGLSPREYATGSIDCTSNTTLTGDDISNIAKPSTHAHFSYDTIYIGNCVEVVSGVKDMTSSPSGSTKMVVGDNNIITSITRSFNECVFCNGVAPTLPHVVRISASFNDTNISSVTFSNTVESIVQSFENTPIVDLVIPDSVTTISGYAFENCINMRTLKIGSGITTIGYDSFAYCPAIETVEIAATTPPELGVYVFGSSHNMTVYVPDESVEAYKTAGRWSNYADRIKPLSQKP